MRYRRINAGRWVAESGADIALPQLGQNLAEIIRRRVWSGVVVSGCMDHVSGASVSALKGIDGVPSIMSLR